MKTTKALRIVALLPLGFMVSILLLFGLGEALGGDLSGLMHLVEVVIAVAVAWVAWKRPRWGGVLMLLGAAFQTLRFWNMFQRADGAAMTAPLFITILPLAFSGLLLLLVDWMDRHPRQAALPK